MSKTWRIFFLIPILFTSALSFAQAVPEISNLDDIAKDLKLAAFKGKKFGRKIKIAILDNGFAGHKDEWGKRLPKCPLEGEDACYHTGKASEADTLDPMPVHGTVMATLVSQVIAKSGADADYELHLFFSYGYTKFADAVETIIKDGYDVVLYSQVWEYGGNGDGKGFINALVDKAVAAGIIWINAAGDFGKLTKSAPVDGKAEGGDEWVVFKNAKGKTADGVEIVCKPPQGEKCPLRLVLSWNDFKNDPDTGTDKDLDLFLYDKSGKQIASSERHQKSSPDLNDLQSSIIPRELIELNKDGDKIAPGTYKVRVKVKSKNFSASQDQLRITASGLGVDLSEPSLGETILPPADNPGVVVVGASDDLYTSRSKKLGVPQAYLKSLVTFKDGSKLFSTSNAAALGAALTVLNLGTGTEKTRDAVIAKLKSVSHKADEIPVISSRKADQIPSVDKAPEGSVERRSAPRQRSARSSSGPYANPGSDSDQLVLPHRDRNYRPYMPRNGQGYGYGQNSPYAQSGYPQNGYGYPQPARTPAYPQAPSYGGAYGSAVARPVVQVCTAGAALPVMYPGIQALLQTGAIPVNLYGNPALAVNYDYAASLGYPPGSDLRTFITPRGPMVLSEVQIAQGVPVEYIEVVFSPALGCP